VCDDTLLACVGGRPDEYELGQDIVGGQNTHMHIPIPEKLSVTV
jgi:hypothetical protein